MSTFINDLSEGLKRILNNIVPESYNFSRNHRCDPEGNNVENSEDTSVIEGNNVVTYGVENAELPVGSQDDFVVVDMKGNEPSFRYEFSWCRVILPLIDFFIVSVDRIDSGQLEGIAEEDHRVAF